MIQVGKLFQRFQAKPLEKMPGGAIESRKSRSFPLSYDLHQPSLFERLYHPIGVHSPYVSNPRARNWLQIGDNRKRLESGSGEPRIEPRGYQLRNERRSIIGSIKSKSSRDLADDDSSFLSKIKFRDAIYCFPHRGNFDPRQIRYLSRGNWLGRDKNECFYNLLQMGTSFCTMPLRLFFGFPLILRHCSPPTRAFLFLSLRMVFFGRGLFPHPCTKEE